NNYIKEVAQLAQINEETWKSETRGTIKKSSKIARWKRVGTHTARRSFATNMYIAGVPPLTIMKFTGHKSYKSFMLYIILPPEEEARILRESWTSEGNHLKVV